MRQLPPYKGLTTLAAALVAVVIAAPVWAQVNTVWLTGGNVVINEEMNDGCLLAVIMLTSTAFIPANTQVRYHVSTEQGFNHFPQSRRRGLSGRRRTP